MTQQVFADRIGKSKSWVDKVERGVRKLDKLSLIQHIADVLRVDPAELLGADNLPTPDNEVDGIEEVRVALTRHDFFNARTGGEKAPDSEEFARQVSHAWLTYQHADYPQLLRRLPNLLDRARRPNTGHHAHEADLVVQVYRITASVLVKIDEPNLALLAADRAVAAASGNQLLTATAAISLSQALRALGQNRLAMATSIAAAHRTAHTASDENSSDWLSVFGTLLLQAALAAARCGDASSVRELVRQADRIAARIAVSENRRQVCFGPVVVEITKVVATVDLGDTHEAIKLHEAVITRDGWRRLSGESRAAYLVDIAGAYRALGDLIAAGWTLIEADRIAPYEARCRPLVRAAIAEVARCAPSAGGLARLAMDLGLISGLQGS